MARAISLLQGIGSLFTGLMGCAFVLLAFYLFLQNIARRKDFG